MQECGPFSIPHCLLLRDGLQMTSHVTVCSSVGTFTFQSLVSRFTRTLAVSKVVLFVGENFLLIISFFLRICHVLMNIFSEKAVFRECIKREINNIAFLRFFYRLSRSQVWTGKWWCKQYFRHPKDPETKEQIWIVVALSMLHCKIFYWCY